jgi:hypothetical protein
MPRLNGYELSAWQNFQELEDGRTLKIFFTRASMPATFDDPAEEEDSETTYFIDGEPCLREDLPSEVTDEVLEELEADATEVSNYDFGQPDPTDFL